MHFKTCIKRIASNFDILEPLGNTFTMYGVEARIWNILQVLSYMHLDCIFVYFVHNSCNSSVCDKIFKISKGLEATT